MGAIRTGIQDHGGMVVNTPASADKIIVDRPSTLDGAVLMKKWVTESIEAGKLLPERPYSAKKVKAKRVYVL
ncbi:hypothetical protein BKA69DRAFT_1099713 [Paraphysoderma sedebokerense]|nr:hypothetical protein BKA69DRAFT_1099713 [Paraphysoderma sedebokerense]